MAKDAVSGYIESLKKHGEPVPTDDETLVTSLDLEASVLPESRRTKTTALLEIADPKNRGSDAMKGGARSAPQKKGGKNSA